MPGGGLTERNVLKVLKACKAREFHVSGRVVLDSPMTFRNPRVFMGGALRPPEFSLSVTDAGKCAAILSNANS